jgi:hypothetical protein
LLDTTSIWVCCASMPVLAIHSDRIISCPLNGIPMHALSRRAGQAKTPIWLVFPRLFNRVAGKVQLCYCLRFDNNCHKDR